MIYLSDIDEKDKRLIDDGANLTGIYWENLIDGYFYAASLNLMAETEKAIKSELIARLKKGQAKDEDIENIFDGNMYEYIDNLVLNMEGDRPKILKFLYKFLEDLFILLTIYFGLGLFSFGKGPWVSDGTVDLDILFIIQIYIVINSIGFIRRRSIKIRSRFNKIINIIGYIAVLFIISLVVLSVGHYLGLNKIIKVQTLHYFIVAAGIYIIRMLLGDYLNKKY